MLVVGGFGTLFPNDNSTFISLLFQEYRHTAGNSDFFCTVVKKIISLGLVCLKKYPLHILSSVKNKNVF